MSIIETLTEGIVNRNMQQEGAALLNKWSSTGLLEGLSDDNEKHNMARLLENQAKELLRESNTMGAGGAVEGFAAVAFPIVRRVFAGLIANDLVSVQPMSLPSGLIFFLDFTFGDEIGGKTADALRTGNVAGKSIYGTDQVGSDIIGGVDLVDPADRFDFSGPGRGGMTGYAYGSPTGSLELVSGSISLAKIVLSGTNGADMTLAELKAIGFDADLLDLADASGTKALLEVSFPVADLKADTDRENLSAIVLTVAQANAVEAASTVSGQVRRLSAIGTDSAGNTDRFRMYFVGDASGITGTAADGDLTGSYPQQDTIAAGGGTAVGAIGAFTYPMERETNIPEIDIKVDSTAITAQTKKLKAKWSPELGQDLNAYHNLDAEVELTSILSEQIALEIDREILADLVNGATAGRFYWSRSPGLFVNRTTGAEINATGAPDFTGTVSEWYETLIETINDVSAQIHRKTLRGGANFCVVSPEVANILEFTAGFRANVTADADKGDIGAVKVGSLNRKFDVIVDPYFPRNAVLVGRKGSSFLESGYVYAPYVPLQTTPTIFGPEDFVPRKGVMTRYAKKMVRADMYGLVIVRDL